MNNNTLNRLTPYRIFYNWSNGDAETFVKDLTATGHFNRQDVDELMKHTEAIITYWVEGFPFFIAFDKGRCCLEIQNQTWFEPLDNLWKLEQHLEDFLDSENYQL
tara:strand:- start:185 stop:499 length:315 start_codon:yes stop_codon:yes gene_type:complete